MLETSTHPEITVSGIRVRDVMQREVATIPEMASVRELAELLQHHEISGAPVLAEDGTVLGVASLWDIVRLASREQQRTELVWPEAGEPFGEGGFYGTPVHARPSARAQDPPGIRGQVFHLNDAIGRAEVGVGDLAGEEQAGAKRG